MFQCIYDSEVYRYFYTQHILHLYFHYTVDNNTFLRIYLNSYVYKSHVTRISSENSSSIDSLGRSLGPQNKAQHYQTSSTITSSEAAKIIYEHPQQITYVTAETTNA